MAPPTVDPDIEAQPNSTTDSQPAIIPNPPLTANTANPPPQGTNANEPYRDNGNAPTQQTADISEIRDENHGDSSDGLGSMYLTEAEKQDAESLANQRALETHGLTKWWEKFDEQVQIHPHWLSQSLTAIDEDKEIEDFASRVPGFFDSRVVPDASSTVVSPMSHQPNADPVFGSRLCDLLKTCIPNTSVLDEKTRKSRLRVCLKCLWYFGKAYNQPGVSQPLPSYFLSSLIPKVALHIETDKDPALRMIGRCVVALTINKLAADLQSHSITVSDGDLACLSAVLHFGVDELKDVLHQPGTAALVNMISLTSYGVGTLVADAVPPDVLDVVRQTFGILSPVLPTQENAGLQLEQIIAVFNGSNSKFVHILVFRLLNFLNTYIRAPERPISLRVSLKRLPYFELASNQLEKSVALLSHICVTFTNLEMTGRTSEQGDLDFRVIGRCVRALVVNILAADLNSRIDSVRDVELQCLSAILGTKSDNVKLLLRHPGAIEITNIVFLAWANIDTASAGIPSDILDVVHRTFGILSWALPAEFQVLPAELAAIMQPDTLADVPDGISSFNPERYFYICLKALWNVVRASNERGNLAPLPSYISAALTNSVMSHRIHQHASPTTSVIGCCVKTLVVNKLAADINLRNAPVGDDELACLTAIHGPKIPWKRQPGAIGLAGVISLVPDVVRSLVTNVLPSDALDVVQQTLDLVSQAHPAEWIAPWIAQQNPNQTISLINASDGDFQRTVSSDLQKLLQVYIPNTSLAVEVRTSTLRICLKSLWCFTRLYHRHDASFTMPLPPYFTIVHATPETTHLIRAELDPTARVIGRCFEALVVDKLLADSKSLTDQGIICLSAILGTEGHIVWLWLDQPGAIDLRNVISLIEDEVDTFVADELPADVLEIFQHTLSIIARQISRGRGFADEDLYMDQVLCFHNICALVADKGGPEWLRYRLEGISSQLPALEEYRDRWQQSDLFSDVSEDGTDDSSLRSS